MKAKISLSILWAIGTCTVLLADENPHSYDPHMGLTPYDFEADGVYYSIVCSNSLLITDSTTVAVTNGIKDIKTINFKEDTLLNCYSGNVVVPPYVNYEGKTYTVTCVNTSAFANNAELRSVTLPATVTDVWYGAFANCPNLEKVVLPDSLKVICEYAFRNCVSLTELHIPNSVEIIGQYAFTGCEQYRGFTFPTQLRELWNFDANLEYYNYDVTLPDSLDKVYFMPSGIRRLEFGKNIPRGDLFCCPRIAGESSARIILPKEMEELVLPKSKFSITTSELCNQGNLKRVILPETDSILVGFFGKGVLGDDFQEFISLSRVPPIMMDSIEFNSYTASWCHNPDKRTDRHAIENNWGCYNVPLIVPAGSEEAYRTAPVWCNFKTIRGDENIDRYLPSAYITEISNSDHKPANASGIYDLHGRRLDRITDPGLYIVNGRKHLVR